MKQHKLAQSLLIILLCLSLIAGSTFAIFTDQKEVGMEVTSGKVDVAAGILPGSVITYSASAVGEGYVSVVNDIAGTFSNGGRITLYGNRDALSSDNLQSAESTIRNTEMATAMRQNILTQANSNAYDGITICRVIIQGLKDAIELLDIMEENWKNNADYLRGDYVAKGWCTAAYLAEQQELIEKMQSQQGVLDLLD